MLDNLSLRSCALLAALLVAPDDALAAEAPAPATTLTGEDARDFFGGSVSGAGDINGDGYDDILVASPGYDDYRGRVYVYLGSESGISTTADLTLDGENEEDGFGAVASAGDVNGDGYDDIVVGAYGYNSYAGRVYLYLGSAGGLSTTPSTTLSGEGREDMFGMAVSGAGDVNGDGYDDVIVGAGSYSDDALTGRAYIYLGSSSGLSSTASTTLTGEAADNYFGGSVSGAGDTNGDGYDDVIVAAYYNGTFRGRAYIFPGSATGVSSTASTTLTGAHEYDDFGYSVSGAGDINGDGYDDVVVGADRYGSFLGQATVYTGSAGGIATTASTALTGASSPDSLGEDVSGAGDVNGDGYDDLIVGAICGGDSGQANVYAGSASGLSTTAHTTLSDSTPDTQFGCVVSGVGDVNGDGYDDVIVGAWADNDRTGRAYVYLGEGDGTDATDTGPEDTSPASEDTAPVSEDTAPASEDTGRHGGKETTCATGAPGASFGWAGMLVALSLLRRRRAGRSAGEVFQQGVEHSLLMDSSPHDLHVR